MNENLAYNLIAAAQEHPSRPAVRRGDIVITYGELERATARVAGLLRERGVRPGDRVTGGSTSRSGPIGRRCARR
jgi:long-chain acyl-CoA synthetase